MLWLAQRLREAAHYRTELSELEKHCQSVAADLEDLAAAQPVRADAAREDEPLATRTQAADPRRVDEGGWQKGG